uniref:NYN domain-containing protein n=1 Tax=Noccaea caerulescens TaxID=107243 RepID=A0A1J3G8G7_NOCCA
MFCASRLSMEEIRETFADAETVVYWDVEDFPVTDAVTFNENIRTALGNVGYRGNVSIRAYYGGDNKPSRSDEIAGITFVSRASKRGRMHSMLLDMHLLALDNLSCAPTNLMAITKDLTWDEDEEETQFATRLMLLNSECYNVLLVVDGDLRGRLTKMPHSLKYTAWCWEDISVYRPSYPTRPIHHSIVESFRRQPPPKMYMYEEEDPCPDPCPRCGK